MLLRPAYSAASATSPGRSAALRTADICKLKYLFCGVVTLLLLLVNPGLKTVQADTGELIAVLIARELKPFIEMVEGLEAYFPDKVVRVFLDRQNRPYSHDVRFRPFNTHSYQAVVAADPQALSYLVQNPREERQAYGMVLNPDRIGVSPGSFCGVSLNIPALEQIVAIRQVFPNATRLGILFNPEYNQAWFENARQATMGINDSPAPLLDLIALTVGSSADIARVFQKQAQALDALLFIPDQTVISQTIIEYVIKTAYLNKIPVIGYNRFFHQSGATLSFIIDPYQVGQALGKLLENWLQEGTCRSAGPPYRLVLNQRVLEGLGLDPTDDLPPNVELD